MSDTKPTKTNQEMRAATNHLMAGVRWCASHLWRWPVVGIGAPMLYALGVTAMYANQYIAAAVFYFIAITWLAARWAAEARSQAKKGGVLFIIIFLGALIFGLSLIWIGTAPALSIAQTEPASSPKGPVLIASLSSWFARCAAYLTGLPWR